MKDIEILEIANVLLETGRKDNKGKDIDKAYLRFHSDIIWKYGCDRLNCATALALQGYKKIIKCKDCKHNHYGECWHDKNMTYGSNSDGDEYNICFDVSDEHFCGYAERKNEK